MYVRPHMPPVRYRTPLAVSAVFGVRANSPLINRRGIEYLICRVAEMGNLHIGSRLRDSVFRHVPAVNRLRLFPNLHYHNLLK